MLRSLRIHSAGSALLLVLAIPRPGSAQATPAANVTSTPAATPSASATTPPATPGQSSDTPPPLAPGKVETARDIAKAAELTPIVPSPKDITRPAFQLYSEVDLPLLGIGLVMATSRYLQTQKAYCAPRCDSNDLNFIDRTTAGLWHPAWSTASDIGLYAIAGSAALLLTADEGPLDALNDAVVVTESALTATAFSTMLTLAAGRPRPFLYGDSAPLADRTGPDAGLSFLSSHTAVSTAIAMSTFIAMKRLHPRSALPWVVLVAGLAASTFVATARIVAGRHFPTDAIGGALIGTSVGFLVPSLHGSPVRVVPTASATQAEIDIAGVF